MMCAVMRLNVVLLCLVLEAFPSSGVVRNRPRIGSSLTLRCTPPTSFPHPKIFWALKTSDKRLTPIDYTDRVTQDPIGTTYVFHVLEH